MSKRLFQILDEMNVNDGNNKTATVGVNNALIEAKKAKGGGHITMGVPESVIMDLFLQKNVIPILLIIDKTEYDKIANQSDETPKPVSEEGEFNFNKWIIDELEYRKSLLQKSNDKANDQWYKAQIGMLEIVIKQIPEIKPQTTYNQ